MSGKVRLHFRDIETRVILEDYRHVLDVDATIISPREKTADLWNANYVISSRKVSLIRDLSLTFVICYL